MKDHLHQPLLFNPAIYNSSDGKQHINYKYITVPQTMLVYAIDNTLQVGKYPLLFHALVQNG